MSHKNVFRSQRLTKRVSKKIPANIAGIFVYAFEPIN